MEELAEGCTVEIKMLPFSGNLLFTVTNHNEYVVGSIDIEYVLKDSNNVKIQEGSFSVNDLLVGGARQCVVEVEDNNTGNDNIKPEVDIGMTEINKKVWYSNYYGDALWVSLISSERIQKSEINCVLKNNHSRFSFYGKIRFYFYDKNENLLDATETSVELGAKEAQMIDVYVPEKIINGVHNWLEFDHVEYVIEK